MYKAAPPISEVRNVIAQFLPNGSSNLAMVAAQLEISPRTLQRRLAHSNLTLTQLVNQARLTKACQLLAQGQLRIGEIAREIGFASPSGFCRAFQSWTGTSPRLFRKNLRYNTN